eukprot:COSAG02_NODE_6741_length_3391_cov_6.722661_3_plen_45_part_00
MEKAGKFDDVSPSLQKREASSMYIRKRTTDDVPRKATIDVARGA